MGKRSLVYNSFYEKEESGFIFLYLFKNWCMCFLLIVYVNKYCFFIYLVIFLLGWLKI